MLFNSYIFILVFLPTTFLGMYWLGRYSHRLAALWLALASLTFYASWDSRFVLLLLASVAFNYGAGYWISLHRNANSQIKSRYTLIGAIAADLSLLGYFKYTNFFIASGNQLFGVHIPALDIILPLGISFFTFTQIAFLVDVYRGIAKEYSFVHYLLFVTYFPHLIAGPILHHKQMMPQFAKAATYRINTEHLAVGLTIFVLGLTKKVLIADHLADYANPIFSAARDGQVLMLVEAWMGSLAYTLQLYFDFSGYSDMAIGLSLLFNIRLPLNFDSPYKATSIIDFWRRWHMTLSVFLRDYLYFPLGGNRKGTLRRYINLMATMLLGGLWHGAGWTFIVWGGLHGLYLLINHGWREVKAELGWREGGFISQLAAGGLTFLAVVVGWVFFRSDNFTSAWNMLSGMAGMHGVSLPISFEGRFSFVASTFPQIHLAFNSFAPASHVSTIGWLIPIAVGFASVWLLPNVNQIMVNYKPAWNDLYGERTTSVREQLHVARWMIWKPSTLNAVIGGILFFIILLSLGENTPSKFLYFQF